MKVKSIAVLVLILALLAPSLCAQAAGSVVLVDNLQPDWTSPGGGGVFSAYVGPPAYGYVSPGTTASYNGRNAGIIKAGLNAKPDGHYDDEGLFAFKPNVTIDVFAAGAVTYDVVNQEGTNPVWMTIEIDTGVIDDRSDNTTYQHVPTSNPAAWHTVDAAAGQWQKWNNAAGDTTGNPLISLGAVAAAHTGRNVVRAYLRLGQGDSYHGSGSGTVGWVDKATLGGVTYDFVVAVPVWTKYAHNPVVTGSMAFDPSVLKDGATYMMWYTHVDDSGNWRIYYADSADGITWANQQSVLSPGASGSWEEARVAGPTVIKEGATYKMWYMGRNASGKEEIGYATSGDGKIWAKYAGNPVLKVTAPGWDSLKVRDPSVILDSGVYKMWYSGCAIWPVFKIGYATSSDGITWTKHVSNPIFSGTTGGWDGFQVYAPSVVLNAGTYHMYFSGTDADLSQRWSTGYATSSDGIAWTEAARNPVLIPDGTDDSADYVSVMNDGGTWRMWYSYGGTYAIGLATLDYSTQLYLDPAVGAILNDNSTTKTYTVRIANAVDLYGYQFVVTFDKTNLECMTAAFDGSFFPTGASSSPGGWSAVCDNINGKVLFARTLLYPEPPKNGSGPLGTLTLRSKSGAANGPYKIDFDLDKLADIESNVLPNTTQYAWLVLTPAGVGTVSGQVDLQGRTNESGGTVTVVNAIGYIQSIAIVNTDGTWSMSGIPVGSYQVNVEMARYLDAQKGSGGEGVVVTSGGTTTLNKVKMLGGDANDDDLVDISDGAIIGGVFGQAAPPADVRADINNDGTVDIQDLVLFGGNYTWTSPVPWS